MAEDPAVRAGVMRAEVFPFRIVGVGPCPRGQRLTAGRRQLQSRPRRCAGSSMTIVRSPPSRCLLEAGLDDDPEPLNGAGLCSCPWWVGAAVAPILARHRAGASQSASSRRVGNSWSGRPPSSGVSPFRLIQAFGMP
jgi:hypothetical protein